MHTYEIVCGNRVVKRTESATPRHAVTDYLRSLGCSDAEMEPLSDRAIAWRGAVYTAVEATETSPDSTNSSTS